LAHFRTGPGSARKPDCGRVGGTGAAHLQGEGKNGGRGGERRGGRDTFLPVLLFVLFERGGEGSPKIFLGFFLAPMRPGSGGKKLLRFPGIGPAEKGGGGASSLFTGGDGQPKAGGETIASFSAAFFGFTGGIWAGGGGTKKIELRARARGKKKKIVQARRTKGKKPLTFVGAGEVGQSICRPGERRGRSFCASILGPQPKILMSNFPPRGPRCRVLKKNSRKTGVKTPTFGVSQGWSPKFTADGGLGRGTVFLRTRAPLFPFSGTPHRPGTGKKKGNKKAGPGGNRGIFQGGKTRPRDFHFWAGQAGGPPQKAAFNIFGALGACRDLKKNISGRFPKRSPPKGHPPGGRHLSLSGPKEKAGGGGAAPKRFAFSPPRGPFFFSEAGAPPGPTPVVTRRGTGKNPFPARARSF